MLQVLIGHLIRFETLDVVFVSITLSDKSK